jgi:hypothetical protein
MDNGHIGIRPSHALSEYDVPVSRSRIVPALLLEI